MYSSSRNKPWRWLPFRRRKSFDHLPGMGGPRALAKRNLAWALAMGTTAAVAVAVAIYLLSTR